MKDKQGAYGSNNGSPELARRSNRKRTPLKLNRRERERRWRWNHRVDAFTGQHPDYMPLPEWYLRELRKP